MCYTGDKMIVHLDLDECATFDNSNHLPSDNLEINTVSAQITKKYPYDLLSEGPSLDYPV